MDAFLEEKLLQFKEIFSLYMKYFGKFIVILIKVYKESICQRHVWKKSFLSAYLFITQPSCRIIVNIFLLNNFLQYTLQQYSNRCFYKSWKSREKSPKIDYQYKRNFPFIQNIKHCFSILYKMQFTRDFMTSRHDSVNKISNWRLEFIVIYMNDNSQ